MGEEEHGESIPCLECEKSPAVVYGKERQP